MAAVRILVRSSSTTVATLTGSGYVLVTWYILVWVLCPPQADRERAFRAGSCTILIFGVTM